MYSHSPMQKAEEEQVSNCGKGRGCWHEGGGNERQGGTQRFRLCLKTMLLTFSLMQCLPASGILCPPAPRAPGSQVCPCLPPSPPVSPAWFSTPLPPPAPISLHRQQSHVILPSPRSHPAPPLVMKSSTQIQIHPQVSGHAATSTGHARRHKEGLCAPEDESDPPRRRG